MYQVCNCGLAGTAPCPIHGKQMPSELTTSEVNMPNVDKKCTTHHFACDCREEKIRILSEEWLSRCVTLLTGDGDECNCDICQIAKKLLKRI